MKTILYSTLLLAALCVAGCNHDILDKQPIDRLSGDVVWTDANLVSAFVNSKYRDLGFGFNWNGDEVMWASASDESMFKHDYGVWTINKSELSPSNLGILSSGAAEYNGNMNPWAKNYRYIKDANTFFEKIASVPNLSTDLRNQHTGEMKFLRAYRYFDLVRNYGGVPLITQSFALGSDFTQVTRNTVQECINFVVKEADEAAALLPVQYGDADLGRATKGAALALKARMLLYAASPAYGPSATWAQAATAAKAVVSLNRYSLYPDYQQLFLTPRNQEIILDRTQTTGTDSYINLERWNGPNGYGGWAGNMPTQNLVDSYETTSGKAITDASSGYDPQNPYVNRDPRFYATVLYNGAPYRGRAVETFMPGGKDSPDGPEPFNTSLTGYYLRKFINENRAFSASVGSQSPWIYFRLGEVLLNYAEAQNEAVGPDASVYDAVNQLRVRAKMPPLPTGLSQSQMRDRIRRERQVELAYEEHRYYDVRRWGIAAQTENQPVRGVSITRDAGGKLTYTYTSVQERRYADRNLFLPIPLKEVQANPKLAQNPGY
ncbi:RagB/SusD family nutrient uptake outer membrane protein [Fibrella sp. HMF5335]|uniref:RagB/SusD family nutrient uptake outer membrane protein n=1 Tax=Fibrella rubiginis TaxID=2817060 RepID=A0A939GER9_9BACT|nr:RagB/SusD family nutrient uptake outer membrane protein [Fibrella rubiginis]MBO0935376.1 RagB/SusD family nutrient uptake outer membrane protein [Fibrella rubiginis]